MNAARIVVLANALSAGGVAAYLARGSDEKPAAAEPVAQLPTTEILVAKSDIGLGQSVKREDLQSQTWPASSSSNSFISKAGKADAIRDIAGSIARAPFIAGEPIREQKLVLALRSITDVNMVEGGSDDQAPKRGSSINVVRYGIASQSTAQK
ncbi:Flp pilus assembly protein CpaB [Bradyrhizobium sp. AUGA SZCCT0431]|nr:Flp pilus assembly protein CpaB [Bradyrhizobium sp. AUGA SZCCT0431]MBR1145136.1 Flp pilus assembly protein CpaB [Bradyrhizobium sp. AUGA SZCCT0431]